MPQNHKLQVRAIREKAQSVSDSRPELARYLISVPMKRFALPQEIAAAIAFSPGEKRPSSQADWEGKVIFRGCCSFLSRTTTSFTPAG